MVNKRLELHEKLCELLESKNVYFQPPENIKIKYPAIIYSLDGIRNDTANGNKYRTCKKYSVIFVTDDPDTFFIDKINENTMSTFIRSYVSDGLYHYVFELYH